MLNINKDEKLINKALAGSQRSWVKLVKRYENLIFNYCLRMTFQHSDAMDLMQEVFLAVYRNLPSYRGSGQFKGWMMRIAANKTTDFLRRRGRNPLHNASEVSDECFNSNNSQANQGFVPAHQDPASYHERHSKNQNILAMLSCLSQEQQLVIELKFFQHFTFEQISQQTNTSVSTIKTRFYAALTSLKNDSEIKNVM
ncbi:MAG: sigma-70 family RNA polymerase sigma factor [Enterobacterales bacterium]|nr:sigma-70 family RNA polymerase sigma factor [Enterobacterales bacterium]